LYIGIWSPWIIAELNRVLTWDWIEHNRGSERACSLAAKKMMEFLVVVPRQRTPYQRGSHGVT
jgi:hypothetical protein